MICFGEPQGVQLEDFGEPQPPPRIFATCDANVNILIIRRVCHD